MDSSRDRTFTYGRLIEVRESPRRSDVLEIDGSYGEGGGQLLRIAVAMSALTRKEIHVARIREGRAKPGLAAQHATAVRAVAALSSAEVSGVEIGSREIVFRPGPLIGGRHRFDVGTAGSVTLVLQACLPVALAAPEPVRLRLEGGTDVPWSPPLDYFARVFLPLLRRIGGRVDVLVHRRGYYPRGGGDVEVSVSPAEGYSPLRLEDPGPVRAIHGIAHVANLPDRIPKRMKHAAMRRLHGRGDVTIEERVYSGDEAVGQGGALVLWAETEATILGAASLAERGKPSERVGEEAASSLARDLEVNAVLDPHAADQLLLYLSLADGPSGFAVREATTHLRTMAWLIPQFLGRHMRIEGRGKLWHVEVAGPNG